MRFERMEYPGRAEVRLDCYLHDSGLRLGQEEKRPAVVVCPGGGYLYLSPREADPVALAYAAADGSSQVLSGHVGTWFRLSVEWLFSVLGELQFEDRSTSRLKKMFEENGVKAPEGADHA